ncbi:MAG TPA: hypothetical protein VII70_00155 [Steroidobacteraceae bacterium]
MPQRTFNNVTSTSTLARLTHRQSETAGVAEPPLEHFYKRIAGGALNQRQRADQDRAWIHIGFLAVATVPLSTILPAEFIAYRTAHSLSIGST